MFGYVTIAKDELKIKEYNQFRSYYCGLCRTIGKNGNQICRLGLTYDMTFLALLLCAVTGEAIETQQKRCFAHPTSRRTVVKENRVLGYCADLNTMLSYLKFDDDVRDDHSVRAFFAKIPFSFAARRAKGRNGSAYEEMQQRIAELAALEKQACGEIDRMADCFARLMEAAMTPDFITDLKVRKALSWLGYNLGRWIYVLDAAADYQKDEEKGDYNPFLISGLPDVERLATTLTFTLDNVAKSYELLPVIQNDEVLRNILYLGLPSRQEMVLCKLKKQEDVHGSV